jgi:hypothetical protein
MISKKTFEKEIEICQKQYAKKKSCAWGKCKNCGVVPLLVKLCKGKLVEDEKEIKKIKKIIC